MTKALTKEDFTPLIGKAFHFEGFDIPLTLDRIIDYPIQPGQTREPFLLVFAGPRSPVMPGAIYDIRAETGETFWFSAQPMLTQTRDRQEYQAVFN
eukprot:gene20255-20163_t